MVMCKGEAGRSNTLPNQSWQGEPLRGAAAATTLSHSPRHTSRLSCSFILLTLELE